MNNIVCFGDSNTYGFRTSDFGRFPETVRWTKLLQKKLGATYNVIEEGLSGRTTVFNDPVEPYRRGADYLIPCLLTHNPLDLLIITLGTNDSKERFCANAPTIAIGLKQLCKQAMQCECWASKPNILVVAPAPILPEVETAVFGSTMGAGCSEKSLGLSCEYERVCKELNLHFLDANGCDIDKEDCIHLTVKGHDQMATMLASVVGQYCESDSNSVNKNLE